MFPPLSNSARGTCDNATQQLEENRKILEEEQDQEVVEMAKEDLADLET